MLNAIWGGRIVSESTLASRINAARTAIGDRGENRRFIRTLPRKGIRFIGTVREEPAGEILGPSVVEVAASEPLPASRSREPIFERRQVTVLCCELMLGGAAGMEAEDLGELFAAYHRWIKESVVRFNGSVGRLTGAIALAYFGHPTAREDDVEQAVRTGLALCTTAAQVEPSRDLRLHVRVGIATGPVIISDAANGNAPGEFPVGEAPGVAAQLQSVGRPDMLLIDSATRRIVGNLFECNEIEPIDISGTGERLHAWNVLGASSIESRFEALHPGVLGPLIGRGEEMELLLRRWNQAKAGDGRVVLISGEPGIGKSRLVAGLQDSLQAERHTCLRYFCSPQHSDSAYYPIIGQIERAAEIVRNDTARERLDKLDTLLARNATPEQDAGLIAEILSLPNDGRYPAVDRVPEQRRRNTLQALMTQMNALARQSMVLIIVEDVHWIDPTSLEVFSRIVNEIVGLRVLLIMTFRPEFAAPWIGQPHVTSITINRLTQRDIGVMIDGLLGEKLIPLAIRQGIIERTDGIPLFVEEITKAVLETEREREERLTAAINPAQIDSVPPSLQASLLARLDRLGPAKEIAQIGAAIGREFSHALLAGIACKPQEELEAALGRLIGAGLLFQQGAPPHANYLFKHALVQDAAYGTLLREPRRALHTRIAETLRSRFAEIEIRPELLAHHLQKAGNYRGSLDQWQKAGAAAMARAANKEAISHFAQAIDCNQKLHGASGGFEQLTRLRIAMANALMQSEGYRSERLGYALEDARAAASRTQSVELQCEAVLASASYYYGSGRNSEYLSLADQLSQDLLDAAHRGSLWTTKGVGHYNRGEFRQAINALRKAQTLNENTAGSDRLLVGGGDPRIVTQQYLSRAFSWMGLIDDLVETTERFSQTIGHMDNPFDAAWTLLVQAHLCELLGQSQKQLEVATRAVEICERYGYEARRGNALCLRARALLRLGEPDAAIADAREGVTIWRGSGVVFHTPERTANLCDILVEAGRIDEATQLLDGVDALVTGTDEASFSAECLRIRGQIAAHRGDLEGAGSFLERAIAISKEQGASLFELRATTGLSLVLAKQGCSKEAETRLNASIAVFETTNELYDIAIARKTLVALDG